MQVVKSFLGVLIRKVESRGLSKSWSQKALPPVTGIRLAMPVPPKWKNALSVSGR